MFWNSEFLSVSSRQDELLSQSTKLSDILFEDELLQELKTSNMIWVNFLIRPEIMRELVDNITQLTEKDCFDKLLYSRIHAAYISCEILTAGSTEIFSALMQNSESLNKILECLIYEPDLGQTEQASNSDHTSVADNGQRQSEPITQEESEKTEQEQMPDKEHHPPDDEQVKTQLPDQFQLQQKTDVNQEDHQVHAQKKVHKVVPQKATLISKLISTIHSTAPADLCCHITKNVETFSNLINVLIQNIHISGSLEILSTFISRTIPPESRYVFCELLAKLDFVDSLINVMTLSGVEDKQRNACQLLCDIIVYGRQEASEQQTQTGPPVQDMLAEQLESQEAVRQILSQMFLINKKRSQITQVVSNETIIHQREQTVIVEQSSDVKRRELIENGIKEIDLTNNNKQDISDQKEKEIHEIIDNEDLISNNKSDIDDKDSEANNLKHSTNGQNPATPTTDSSSIASDDDDIAADTNVTAIICGMKVLRCLIEWRRPNNNNLSTDTVEKQETFVFKAMNRIQDAVEEYLVKFHELLLNPPRQEPIKTTFGVIQKPLGYIRLEVINLIRALISVNSPKIIMKLVELRTMKVIIDLFISYSWNNLLHTQVEQALCMIIKISRHDEDLFFADYWNKRLDEFVTIVQVQDEENSNQCNGIPVQNGQKCEQGAVGDSSPIATSKLKQQNSHLQQKLSQPQSQQPKTELLNDELNECNSINNTNQQQCKHVDGLEDEENGTPEIPQTNGFSNNSSKESTLVVDRIGDEEEEVEEDKQKEQQEEGQQHQHQQQQEEQQQNSEQQQRQNYLPAKRKPSLHLTSPTVFLAEKIEVPVTPSIALLHQILNDCDLIGRLLQCSNGEANFGHIIQIINSIAINRDLDTIKSHLKDIETKRPELFDRWTTFVTVDVASFKETSLYFDIHSPRPLITTRKNDAHWVDPYLSFTREQVLPKINVDVIPLVVVGKKASKQG